MNVKTSDFDEKFEEGEDITASLDLDKAHRPGLQTKRVNVNFPQWMIDSLGKEAHRLGITPQSLIKLWVADKLDQHQHH